MLPPRNLSRNDSVPGEDSLFGSAPTYAVASDGLKFLDVFSHFRIECSCDPSSSGRSNSSPSAAGKGSCGVSKRYCGRRAYAGGAKTFMPDERTMTCSGLLGTDSMVVFRSPLATGSEDAGKTCDRGESSEKPGVRGDWSGGVSDGECWYGGGSASERMSPWSSGSGGGRRGLRGGGEFGNRLKTGEIGDSSSATQFGGGGYLVNAVMSAEAAWSSTRFAERGAGSSGVGTDVPCNSTRPDGIPDNSGTGAGIAGSSGKGGGVALRGDTRGADVGCSEILLTGKGGCVGNKVVSGRVVVDAVFLGLACSRAKSLAATLLLEVLGVSHPYISANLLPLPLL